MTKRLFTLLSVAFLLVGLASGCAPKNNNATPGAGNKTNILFSEWNNQDSVVYHLGEELAAEYNARTDTTAKISTEHIPGTDNFYPKLNAGLAGGTAPDIFTMHAAGKMKTYVDGGSLLDLTSILNDDSTWKDSFTSGAFNLLTFNDKIYGIPTAFATAPLFYNKEIFDKYNLTPPQTYDDLKSVIKTLKDNNVTPFAFGAKDAWTAALFSEVIANRIGGDEPFNALMNGGGTWLDPSYLETGRVLNELKAMGAFPSGFLGLDNTAITSMFKTGGAAMFVTGSWAIGEIAAADSAVKDKVGIAKFPTFPGGKGDIDTWLGQPSYNLVVNAKTKDQKAAIEYLKLWTSPASQKRIAEEAGDIPAVKIELDPTKVPPVSKELQDQMSTMKGMVIFYDVGLGAKIGDEYNTTIQAILGGEKVDTAFKNLETYTKNNR